MKRIVNVSKRYLLMVVKPKDTVEIDTFKDCDTKLKDELVRIVSNYDDIFQVPKGLLLAQGQTQGSAPRAHRQALTTGPFGNTCEEDAVSLDVAMGGCRTQMSTTKGIQRGSNTRTTQHIDVSYQLSPTSHIYLPHLTQIME
jgi:hypothetical protein